MSWFDETQMASSWPAVLTAAQRERVRRDVVLHQVPEGTVIGRKGERADSWLGVIEGLLKISVVSIDGKSVSFTGVRAGGWFGEGTLLKDEPLKYDIVALRESTLARMPRATFEWLLENSIGFNRYLLDQFNERLGQFIGMIENERLLGPDTRLARCLSGLCNPILYPGSDLRIEITQEELGYLAGVSRQRVNQALHKLENVGLVRVEYGAVWVTDLAGLGNYDG